MNILNKLIPTGTDKPIKHSLLECFIVSYRIITEFVGSVRITDSIILIEYYEYVVS